ncbi:hypothetical protein ACHAXR_006592 [Thalassiosira sp. AJA248-18]
MRHGRAKQSRRTLQFYRLNAPHLKPPYKLLLDGTFLVASIRNKVPLYERFAKTLQNEAFTCYVTRSTLTELETLSERAASNNSHDYINFFAQARQYGLDECEIIESDKVPTASDTKRNKEFKEFSDASRDIFHLSTDGGSNRQAYFVATQDDTLADALRAMPYVPLFRLGRAVLLLESPSSASRSYTGNKEQNKLASAGGLMTAEERKMVNAVNKKDKLKRREMMKEEQKKLVKRTREEVGGGFNMRKKKRAKGPNPLSCKGKGKK